MLWRLGEEEVFSYLHVTAVLLFSNLPSKKHARLILMRNIANFTDNLQHVDYTGPLSLLCQMRVPQFRFFIKSLCILLSVFLISSQQWMQANILRHRYIQFIRRIAQNYMKQVGKNNFWVIDMKILS